MIYKNFTRTLLGMQGILLFGISLHALPMMEEIEVQKAGAHQSPVAQREQERLHKETTESDKATVLEKPADAAIEDLLDPSTDLGKADFDIRDTDFLNSEKEIQDFITALQLAKERWALFSEAIKYFKEHPSEATLQKAAHTAVDAAAATHAASCAASDGTYASRAAHAASRAASHAATIAHAVHADHTAAYVTSRIAYFTFTTASIGISHIAYFTASDAADMADAKAPRKPFISSIETNKNWDESPSKISFDQLDELIEWTRDAVQEASDFAQLAFLFRTNQPLFFSCIQLEKVREQSQELKKICSAFEQEQEKESGNLKAPPSLLDRQKTDFLLDPFLTRFTKKIALEKKEAFHEVSSLFEKVMDQLSAKASTAILAKGKAMMAGKNKQARSLWGEALEKAAGMVAAYQEIDDRTKIVAAAIGSEIPNERSNSWREHLAKIEKARNDWSNVPSQWEQKRDSLLNPAPARPKKEKAIAPIQPSPWNELTAEERKDFPKARLLESVETTNLTSGRQGQVKILGFDDESNLYIRIEEEVDPDTKLLISRSEMLADLLLVILPTREDPEAFTNSLRSRGVDIKRLTPLKPEGPSLYKLQLNSHDINALPAALNAIKDLNLSGVIAQPNYLSKISEAPISTQHNRNRQWNLFGQYGIHAESAWEHQHTSATPIGVIDTGIDYKHAELKNSMWDNSVTSPLGSFFNWLGFSSTYYGHGCSINNTGNLSTDQTTDLRDEIGHGSHLAGIIGAVGKQIIGVAWKAQLMDCKYSLNGEVNFENCSKCIKFACDHGATILNCSFGDSKERRLNPRVPRLADLLILDGLIYARKKNVIVVNSAGNLGKNVFAINDDSDEEEQPKLEENDTIHYPSGFANISLTNLAKRLVEEGGFSEKELQCFGLNPENLIDEQGNPFDSLDNIVVVAASTSNGQLAEFSNYGTNVHLAAPGEDIFSTVPSMLFQDNRSYSNNSGTSMAAAHVTGALALLKEKYPNDSYANLIARLITTTDDLVPLDPELDERSIIGGRLNLGKALSPNLTLN